MKWKVEQMPKGLDRPECKVRGCKRPHRGHGYCNMHYQRWMKTGEVGPAGRSRREPSDLDDGRSIEDHLIELFLKGIRKLKSGCWVCDNAYAMNTGYTEVKIRRGSNGIFRSTTHTLSFRHFKGPIPEGVLVCHRCDNRKCCNPEHLFLGDYSVNQADMASKDRVAFGDRHYNARLTSEDVLAIYKMHRNGKSQVSIAKCFDVSHGTIYSVTNGKTWRRLYDQHFHSKEV